MSKLQSLILVGASAAFAMSASYADPPTGVTVQDLGVGPGGTAAYATGLNNRGQVIGLGDESTPGLYPGILWYSGLTVDLPFLSATDVESAPISINDAGRIAGYSDAGCYSCALTEADVWHDGVVALIPLPYGYTGGNAWGINSRGQIVGGAAVSQATRNLGRAFVSFGGVATVLEPLPGYAKSTGLAINNPGAVVGVSISADSSIIRATLWSKDKITDLGFLPGGDYSEPHSINAHGQITGTATYPPLFNTVAVLWDNGKMINLGTLPGGTSSSDAFSGITDSGIIVGTSDGTAAPLGHAVIWKCGKIIDLGVLAGGTYSFATGINDRGEVVGGGDGAGFVNGEHALLWHTNALECK